MTPNPFDIRVLIRGDGWYDRWHRALLRQRHLQGLITEMAQRMALSPMVMITGVVRAVP
jgi:hypothetical protein